MYHVSDLSPLDRVNSRRPSCCLQNKQEACPPTSPNAARMIQTPAFTVRPNGHCDNWEQTLPLLKCEPPILQATQSVTAVSISQKREASPLLPPA